MTDYCRIGQHINGLSDQCAKSGQRYNQNGAVMWGSAKQSDSLFEAYLPYTAGKVDEIKILRLTSDKSYRLRCVQGECQY